MEAPPVDDDRVTFDEHGKVVPFIEPGPTESPAGRRWPADRVAMMAAALAVAALWALAVSYLVLGSGS